MNLKVDIETISNDLPEFLVMNTGIHDMQYRGNIEADTIATGWILLGMATNEQLIVKNVTKCPYQNYEVSRY